MRAPRKKPASPNAAPPPRDRRAEEDARRITQLEESLRFERRWNRELSMRHRAIDDVLKGQDLILTAVRKLLRSSGYVESLPPIDARYRASDSHSLEDEVPF